jgi:hypothetical protein
VFAEVSAMADSATYGEDGRLRAVVKSGDGQMAKKLAPGNAPARVGTVRRRK